MCGERVLEPGALTLRHFLVHTVAHELFLLSAAAAMLIYLINTVFITAVKVAGAAVALALA